jgi:hypothetical protein
VEWAGSITERQIRLVQERDRRDIESFTKQSNLRKFSKATNLSEQNNKSDEKSRRGIWRRLLDWLTNF